MHEVTVRVASGDDIAYVGSRLRAEDRREVAALGMVVDHAVRESAKLSEFTWAGIIDGEPAMIFGIDHGAMSPEAEIWALGTDKCAAAPREMVVYGRRIVAGLLEIWPVLTNHCHADNKPAIRWLKHLGFEISEPEKIGVRGEKFCKLTIRKKGV